MTDEQIIREALEAIGVADIDGNKITLDSGWRDALAALDRLSARSLPELPEGWHASVVAYFPNEPGPAAYKATLSKPDWTKWNPLSKDWIEFIEAKGPTPRDAVLAAIKQIGKQS